MTFSRALVLAACAGALFVAAPHAASAGVAGLATHGAKTQSTQAGIVEMAGRDRGRSYWHWRRGPNYNGPTFFYYKGTAYPYYPSYAYRHRGVYPYYKAPPPKWRR